VAGFDVGLTETIASYVAGVLAGARHEQLTVLEPLTQELPMITGDLERSTADGGHRDDGVERNA
jgi:hypothetical protein